MPKRFIIPLLIALVGLVAFVVALMFDRYLLAIAALLVPAVVASFYAVGKARLSAKPKSDRHYSSPHSAPR